MRNSTASDLNRASLRISSCLNDEISKTEISESRLPTPVYQ